MVAAIVVEALFDIEAFRVVGIKNKYLGSAHDIMKTGSPSILINVEARHEALPPLVFEVQVLLMHCTGHLYQTIMYSVPVILQASGTV